MRRYLCMNGVARRSPGRLLRSQPACLILIFRLSSRALPKIAIPEPVGQLGRDFGKWDKERMIGETGGKKKAA